MTCLASMEIFPPEVLAEQTDEVERAWYQVLAQDLAC